MHLVIVDTTQIQPYVFGSNRLRENVGASHLVAQATGAWALGKIDEVAKPTNIVSTEPVELNKTDHIEDGMLEAEVIYAGGGNTAVVFKEETTANNFIRTLSKQVLMDAPGLQVVMARKEFDWRNNSLVRTVKAAFDQLTIEKRSRPLSAPLLGLSVTATCQSTGLPAIGVSPEVGDDEFSTYPASAETLFKLGEKFSVAKAANKRLRNLCEEGIYLSYDFPLDFDKLGRSFGDQSFVAVVHADGDGMGNLIKGIGKKFKDKADGNYSKPNREYINAMRDFSEAVNDAAKAALRATISKLIDGIHKKESEQECEIAHPLASATVAPIKLQKSERGKYLLPLRPIVFGGDDVTFVCDGRLGISLALEYMKHFAKETANRKEKCGGKITSCAGIAIVKSHYPFARAYGLAEELCKSAKRYKRKKQMDVAYFDWHFALGGLMGNLDEIREREYKPRQGRLYQRPVSIEQENQTDLHAWSVVKKALDAFQGRFDSELPQEKQWSGKRNKTKALREALRDGEEAVDKFIKMFRLDSLPNLGEGEIFSDLSKKGWRGEICGYFDATELADLYLPLKGEEKDGSGNSPESQK